MRFLDILTRALTAEILCLPPNYIVAPGAQAARGWTCTIAALGLLAAMWDEGLPLAAANRVLIGEMDFSRA